ncbi:DUF2851 family protein [Winogradskyella poriferorum]|uniref:DUF2851 family protein n=1 Tax=Winogradskyella poriferorum TaxID=307627 RepID=UPI003D655D7F
MREDFLHYVWKYNAFKISGLLTSEGENIFISNLGQHNFNSGPDFFGAKIQIGEQLWAGNVEIHLKSSDWYLHGHEKDKAYDNVILHVVWEDDAQVFRRDNTIIPTLELKNIVDVELLNNYKRLFNSKSWINCEDDFKDVDDFILNNWLDRLFIERLERKSTEIEGLLEDSNYNWEAVLFKMLFKNFGLKINGESMMSIANKLDFTIVRKVSSNKIDLEALLFGMSGLLEEDLEIEYYTQLREQYKFLSRKFNLSNEGIIPLRFFRLRPINFPTIRLAQLSGLYSKETALFSKIISAESIENIYDLFKVEVNEFWQTHYTFSKISKHQPKNISKSFIDLILINTIIPLKFAYNKAQGVTDHDKLLNIIRDLKIESNKIVDRFLSLKDIKKSTLASQSLLQLKNEYCDKNKCLECAVGNSLIIKK